MNFSRIPGLGWGNNWQNVKLNLIAFNNFLNPNFYFDEVKWSLYSDSSYSIIKDTLFFFVQGGIFTVLYFFPRQYANQKISYPE